MISTTTNSISYSGNNSTTTAYVIPFPYLAKEDFTVIETNSAGTETLLVYGTDYSISNLTDSNGRITSGTLKTVVAVPVASTLSIKRLTTATQTLDIVQGGTLSAEGIETALDRVTMIAQEARRDAVNDGETNVEAAGTGLVAQTAAGAYSCRTISPASGAPFTVTNGDGVSGNPTIDLDLTLLDTVTSAANASLVPVIVDGAEKKITIENLFNRTIYKEVHLSSMNAVVSGGSSGITITDDEISYTSTATGTSSIRFFVPEDYAGGEIKFKFRNYLASGVNGEQFVWSIRAYDQNVNNTFTAVSGAEGTYAQTHSSTDTRSTAMSVGADLVAGRIYLLYIEREITDPLDNTSRVARITDMVMQYPAAPNLTGW